MKGRPQIGIAARNESDTLSFLRHDDD